MDLIRTGTLDGGVFVEIWCLINYYKKYMYIQIYVFIEKNYYYYMCIITLYYYVVV